ncbi:hypothetical protein BJY00DRAFT_53584 [Aspergillus carlsbadensis]|nr:hypothetical protein BJY00DRAFT_53584 [Aspergillus carlsbadensis]
MKASSLGSWSRARIPILVQCLLETRTMGENHIQERGKHRLFPGSEIADQCLLRRFLHVLEQLGEPGLSWDIGRPVSLS